MAQGRRVLADARLREVVQRRAKLEVDVRARVGAPGLRIPEGGEATARPLETVRELAGLALT